MEEVFPEGKIGEEKFFDGVVLPRTLSPAVAAMASLAALVNGVKKKKRELCEMLYRHGALLFRGFDVRGASDFRQVVEAFEWEEMPYLGGAPRLKVEERVYTANEAPLDLYIKFHHEMSLMRESPSKIFFFCETPPGVGGETCLLRSDVLFQEMERREASFVSKVARVGLLSKLLFPKDDTTHLIMGNSWMSMLGTDDPIEAKRRAMQTMMCSSFDIREDGSAEIIFGPLEVVRTINAVKVWGNNIEEDQLRLGDGSRIPREASEAYKEVLSQISVELRWEKGDVLLVDNRSIQHARRPGKPPRRIFVSLCK